MKNKKVLYISLICLVIGIIITIIQIANYSTYNSVDAKVVDFKVYKSEKNKRGSNYEVLEYEYNGKTYNNERKVVFRFNSKDIGTVKSIKINPDNPNEIFNHTFWGVIIALDATSLLFVVICIKEIFRDKNKY